MRPTFTTNDDTSKPAPISFWQALIFWLKLGLTSFGAPAAQIAIMHDELVEQRRWISERRFLHALNFCMLLPGPEAQQLAIYIGWLMHRTWGGIVAGVLFVLPSLLLMITLAWLYVTFGQLQWVTGLFYGVKPAIMAILIQAVCYMASRVLKNGLFWSIAIASFIAIFVLDVPFPLVVATAAGLGYIGGRWMPHKLNVGSPYTSTYKFFSSAYIDDDTPIPVHARFCWRRTIKIISISIIMWAAPVVFLTITYGWQHTLTQMSYFFTKVALLTFGGVYAALPYIHQGVVDHYGWLTTAQMIDGLALGESTPGPLIMVTAFISFIGAYAKALFGPKLLLFAGAIAAVLVTWVTCLPSFVFVLIGGPIIEAKHHSVKLSATLNAVTAAMVGAILNLVLVFADHVLWPKGLAGSFDWKAGAMALAATIALIYFKSRTITIIALCALIGLTLKFFIV